VQTDNLAEYGRFAVSVSLRVFGVLVSLASVIITSRGLGVEGRGLFFTCTSAAQIAAQLLALGMPSAIVLVVASNPALGRRAIGRALAASAGAGLVAFIITGLLLRLVHPRWVHPAVIELGPLVAGLVATQIFLWWCSSLTQALGAVDRIPLIELIYRVVSVSWAYVALFYLKISFPIFLFSLILVDAFVGGFWMVYVWSLTPSSAGLALWPGEWRRWSLNAYLPLSLYSAMRRVDALLLTSIAGLQATGLYSIGIQVMDMCQIAPVFLGQKAMYAFSAGHGDSPSMRRLRRVLPFAVAGTMVTAGITAHTWASLLFGKQFSAVGPIILALAVGGAMLAWETVAVQEINASGYPLKLTLAWLICFCVAVVLLLTLVPFFRATGAAVAMSTSYFVLAVMIRRLRGQIRKASQVLGPSAASESSECV
jgi:O-antigen/teichoic acid export membrane protein